MSTCLFCENSKHKFLKPFDRQSVYGVFRCTRCKVEFVSPMPNQRTLSEYYSNYHHSNVSREEFLQLKAISFSQAKRIKGFILKFL